MILFKPQSHDDKCTIVNVVKELSYMHDSVRVNK